MPKRQENIENSGESETGTKPKVGETVLIMHEQTALIVTAVTEKVIGTIGDNDLVEYVIKLENPKE